MIIYSCISLFISLAVIIAHGCLVLCPELCTPPTQRPLYTEYSWLWISLYHLMLFTSPTILWHILGTSFIFNLYFPVILI